MQTALEPLSCDYIGHNYVAIRSVCLAVYRCQHVWYTCTMNTTYVPVIHLAPSLHSSPLGVVGVVGVDPESVGRQTTNRLSTNHSLSQVTKCSFLLFFQILHMYLKILCVPNKHITYRIKSPRLSHPSTLHPPPSTLHPPPSTLHPTSN